MQPLEEPGHHLDGVHARGAGDLHDDQDDADGLADMLERHRERIDDVDVDEGDAHAAQHEEKRMQALHADHEVADRDDDRLEGTEQDHEQPAAEVGLAGGEVTDALAVDLELVDGDEHVAADPEGQVGVEGRDAGAEARDRVDGLRLELDGRGHEIGHVLDVDAHEIGELAERLGRLQRRDVVGGLVELLLDLGERGVRLLEHGLGLGER